MNKRPAANLQASPAVERAYRLGLEHHKAGRLKDAEAHYRKLLKIEPRHAGGLFWFGSIALETGRLAFAVDLLTRACALEPNVAAFHSNLGEACSRAGNVEASLTAFRRALALEPENAERHFNLALALRQAGQGERALEALEQAARLAPENPRLRLELARLLEELAESWRGLGKLQNAREACQKSLRLEPGRASAHHVLGMIQSDAQRLDEAIESFERALGLDPGLPHVRGDLGLALLGNGRVEEAVSSWDRALEQDATDAISDSNRLFALAFHPAFDDAAISAEARKWAARQEAPLAAHVRAHDGERSPDKKLRIGYVCSVFREHALGLFIVPLILHRQRDGFELYCYSSLARPDGVTERLRGSADAWRDVPGLSDIELAELIRSDGIDVLVDLNMHMATPRLRTFACRPAPVQLSWAYPGTTGLSHMDYRLSDRHLDPPGAPLPYAEASIVLPDSYWCYDPLTASPQVNPLPALSAGHICFGNLNGVWKLSRDTLALWSQVLSAVPKSTLVLLSPGWQNDPERRVGEAERRLLGFLEDTGIASERVRFLPRAPRLQYFDYYHQIDVCLDSLPYAGHTTSLDALWMGVPVITLRGRTVVGRSGLTFSSNLGLPELLTTTESELVERAVALASDLPALDRLRQSLRARLEASRLMDGPRFARNMERACRVAWQRYCAGVAPERVDLPLD